MNSQTLNNPENDQPLFFEEDFGIRMLLQMGWKEGQGIGKNPLSYQTELYEIKPRAPGAGLGSTTEFDRIKLQKTETEKVDKNAEEKSRIFVISGKHKGTFGILKETKENKQCVVEINGYNFVMQIENISFDFPIENKFEMSPKNNGPENLKLENEELGNLEKEGLKWATSHLTVRIASKKYQEGKYYLKKGTILDVLSSRIILLIEGGEILEDIKERYLETIIPGLNENVLILKGKFKHQTGKLVKRNKKENLVWVQVDNSSEICELKQEDCCAFEK